jgi:peroxin-14
MSSSGSASVQSAVTFLRDPSVRDSPLSKKLAFLEAKGLSPQDIDAALRIAGGSSSSSAGVGAGSYNAGGYAPYPGQPGQRQPDWRDWFIMATVGGAVGTVAYSLARVSLHRFAVHVLQTVC